jgi:hypothetical protein
MIPKLSNDIVLGIIKRPTVLWASAFLFVFIDYSCGPTIQFPAAFLFPVILAAWFHNVKYAYTLAIILPMIRFSFNLFVWTTPWSVDESFANAVIRMTVFVVLTYLVHRVSAQNEELAKEVKTLSGILPICAFCKKIRTEKNEWVPVENYVRDRSDAEFSHGFCPECGKKHYGDILEG